MTQTPGQKTDADTQRQTPGQGETAGWLLGEEDYLERMQGEVSQWRKTSLRSGRITSYDGTQLQYYYALQPEAAASIVVLHGFCEFIGKYRELLYTFFRAGYNVFFHEQRGHGRSGRETDPEFVYVRDFAQYERDLKFLLDQKILPLLGETLPEAKRREHPLFLFAHSMGGAVGALFLEDFPEYFDAAVLSSPMLQMKTGGLPRWKVNALLAYTKLFHREKQPLFGQKGFDPEEKFESSCALSRARFDYVLEQRRNYPEYQTGGATLGWSAASVKAAKRVRKHAARVQIPVLLFQAGEDTLVEPEAQEAFAAASARTRLVRFANARHEIMNGTQKQRESFYRTIFVFYRKQVLEIGAQQKNE